MSELLPCPFCGGEAEVLTAESMHGGYLFGIMCNDCRSRGDVYDNEAEAIATWNTRAERVTVYPNGESGISVNGITYVPERTCHDVKPSLPFFKCDSCGLEDMGGTELWIQDGFYRSQKPNYCPNCGAKVVN